jgi:hypothetical protein
MDTVTRRLVRERARNRCEYCLLRQDQAGWAPFHIEHIVARQHRGPDNTENLALACHRCNLHKGPNLSGYDPDRSEIIPLFHPRRDQWSAHFRFDGPFIRGLSAIGRTTIWVLQMNIAERVKLREMILEAGGTLDQS